MKASAQASRIRLVRALRHRNYRLFVAGQSISLVGTWLTRFATIWMAYRLTGSPFVLGMVAFFGHAPTVVIAPIAGVLIDRWDRHRVLVLTQVAAMLQSAALAAFAFADAMTVWHLMALGAVQGVINGFDMPARQSFLRQMIDDPADLPNAIALNSSMVNLAKLAGPAIAAVLVAMVGEAWCFAIDAASYVAVVCSLLAIRVAKPPRRARTGHVWAELAEGVRYAGSVAIVRAVLILLAISSVLGGAYGSLLPAVAGEHLGGGPYTLGVLMSASGSGALCGALYLAHRTTVVGLGGVIARCAFVLGAGLAALELAPSVWLAAPILFVIGMALMIQLAATNTIVQTVVDPDKLGRVMSLYAVAFSGGMPLGAFLEGALASRIGAIHTFAIAGVGCMLSALVFYRALPELRIATRPLYIRLGLVADE
ncbi:MAG TPA: MFS transporter [Kofleriaceae bacterium]